MVSMVKNIFSGKNNDSNKNNDAIELATQRQLIWRRFKRHRLGFTASIVVVLFYLVVLFADFFINSSSCRLCCSKRVYASSTH